MAPKTSKGRRKIPIRKIENCDNRRVTFSKRKLGAFKKASELTTLCGTQMAVILFNENGKPFSYGNPSVNGILDRFMGVDPQRAVDPTVELVGEEKDARIQEIKTRIVEVEAMLNSEQQRGNQLSQEMADHAKERWWEGPVEEMDLPRLQWRKKKMEQLKLFFQEQKNLKANEDLNPLYLLANQISP